MVADAREEALSFVRELGGICRVVQQYWKYLILPELFCFLWVSLPPPPSFLHQQVERECCGRRRQGLFFFRWSVSRPQWRTCLTRSGRWNDERTESGRLSVLGLAATDAEALVLPSPLVTSSHSARWFLPLRLAAAIVKRRKYLRSRRLWWCNAKKKRISVYSPTLFNFINYFWGNKSRLYGHIDLSLLSYWRAFWALSLFSSESPLCSCYAALIDLLFCTARWQIFVLLILCTAKTCTGKKKK